MDRTLLLVDDEENIVRALVRLLRREGYKILTANSGKEGLEVLKDNPVGVIISDQRMPEMNGTEFLSEVKELYPETIRIVLSGYTDLKSVTDAINEGAIYKFLTKPWEDELIRKNIEEAFRQYELAAENIRLQKELKRANEDLLDANKQLGQDIQVKTRHVELNTRALMIAQEVLEHLPMGIIGAGDDGMIAIGNLKAHEILYPQQGTLVGMFTNQVFPDDVIDVLASNNGEEVFLETIIKDNKHKVIINKMGQGSDSSGKIIVLIPENN